jgi:hypothetical protein
LQITTDTKYIRVNNSVGTEGQVLTSGGPNSSATWAAKTFVIDHPDDENKYLVHACLEGPEAGVYYRGKAEITQGKCVEIKLPNYVNNLATDFTVQITPIFDGEIKSYASSEVQNGCFTVYGQAGSFYWLVQGRRLSISVEQDKNTVNVKGSGPYRWI